MAPSPGRLVFVCYAHEDDDVRRRLEVVLKPLVRNNHLELWADDRIGVSRDWNDEIASRLDRAEMAVLLVSADFLASDYITEVELPCLVQRGIPLVCVPVGSCAWDSVEALRRVQWPVPPEQPLRTLPPEARDGVLMTVYRSVAARASSLGIPSVPGSVRSSSAVVEPEAGARGPLFGVPDLPVTYQHRLEDLAALKRDLAGSAGVGLVGTAEATGLHGRGGVGKSVLAAALCRDDEVRSWFPDGLFWVTLGESSSLLGAQQDLLHHLGDDGQLSDPLAGLRRLRRALRGRRCLLVVDDVWSAAAAQAFAAIRPPGRLLYTTRDAELLAAVGAAPHRVDVLDPAESFAFLERTAGPVADLDREAVEAAVARTGGVMLALSVLAGVARAGGSWSTVTDRLARLAEVFGEHPYADVFASLRVAVDQLDRPEAERYFLLGAFPDDVEVPEEVVGPFLGLTDPGPLLDRLSGAGLLVWAKGGLRLHDLQRAFVIFSSDQPWALVHRHLLDRLRPSEGWTHIPDDHPYLWDHLLYHLQMAGEHEELARLATNGRWLARRLHRDGVTAAEADVARAAAVRPRDPRVQEVLALLRRWALLFRPGLGLDGLAATMVSRLPIVEHQVEDLLGPVWLRPAGLLPDASRALARTLAGHAGSVTAVAYSPDGRWLATGGEDGIVRVWEAAAGIERQTLTAHHGTVTAVAFDPESSLVASAGLDGVVRLWEVGSGAALRTFPGADRTGVHGVAFSPDGRVLASAGGDGIVRISDRSTGAVVRVLAGHAGPVRAVAFAPDGRILASAAEGSVRLWDAATGGDRGTLVSRGLAVDSLAFAAVAPVLAAGGQDRAIRVWHISTARSNATVAGGPVTSVALSADGQVLASAGETVRLWDAASGTELRRPLVGHVGTVNAVAFAPDGATLATGGSDQTVRLWQVETATPALTAVAHAEQVTCLALAPDGAALACGGRDPTVHLLKPTSDGTWASASGISLTGHTGRVHDLAFAADGAVLASAGVDGTVRIWDARTGVSVRVLAGHTGRVLALAFGGASGLLASGGAEGRVRLWDPASGAVVQTLPSHDGPVRTVAFAPEGRTLATAGDDQDVRIWDAADGTCHRTLRGHAERVLSTSFAPDGRTLATGGRDAAIWLWDVGGGSARMLTGHAGTVNAVAFAPDGAALASASADHSVRIWDVATGRQLTSIRLGGAVWSCVWAPDGVRLLVASEGVVITLEVMTPERRPGRSLQTTPAGGRLRSLSARSTAADRLTP